MALEAHATIAALERGAAGRAGEASPRFSARFDVDAAYYVDVHPGRVQVGFGVGLPVVF